jgi:uncharacterized membrane protein YgcG
MKNVLIRGLFLVLGLWSTLQTLAAQDLGKWSKSDGLVVVRTANNPLSAEEEQALEILLQTRLDSTGARLVVVLTDGIQDDINLYAVELGQRWGIGSADEDNGALLLVDLENRQMALQVGYGLEDELPDITCSHIIQNEIAPAFKAGNVAEGLRAGAEAVFAATQGQYRAQERGGKQNLPVFAPLLVVAVLMLLASVPAVGRSFFPWAAVLAAAPVEAVLVVAAAALLAAVVLAEADPAAAGNPSESRPVGTSRAC